MWTIKARRALALSLLLSLAACADGPVASPQADQEAKSFNSPEPSKGALYVYRHELMGFVRPIDVAIQGGASAKLPINTYVRLEGPPGPIEIDCKMDNNQAAAQIEIAEGRTRYVEVSTTTGLWASGCKLREVAPEIGQAAVRGSRRVDTM